MPPQPGHRSNGPVGNSKGSSPPPRALGSGRLPKAIPLTVPRLTPSCRAMLRCERRPSPKSRLISFTTDVRIMVPLRPKIGPFLARRGRRGARRSSLPGIVPLLLPLDLLPRVPLCQRIPIGRGPRRRPERPVLDRLMAAQTSHIVLYASFWWCLAMVAQLGRPLDCGVARLPGARRSPLATDRRSLA